MGHAGAIVHGEGRGTPQSKMAALRTVGVDVAEVPTEVVNFALKHLKHTK
jgi:succinyl-CoA synthetase alpha subunit